LKADHYAKEKFAGKPLAEAFKNSFSQNLSNITHILGMLFVKLFATRAFGAIGAIGK